MGSGKTTTAWFLTEYLQRFFSFHLHHLKFLTFKATLLIRPLKRCPIHNSAHHVLRWRHQHIILFNQPAGQEVA